jgi:hypothetical protein
MLTTVASRASLYRKEQSVPKRRVIKGGDYSTLGESCPITALEIGSWASGSVDSCPAPKAGRERAAGTGDGAGFFIAVLFLAFLNGGLFLTVFAAGTIANAFFRASGAGFLARSGFLMAPFFRALRSCGVRRLAFLPAALSFRFGLPDSGGSLVAFTFPKDACDFTASFTRVTAAFASRSAFRTWSAPEEYRSVMSKINTSILASRLRALFAFIATPLEAWQWLESYRPKDALAS